MKLNMSKFKKVASNKQSTTMLHDDGHTIEVHHKALSPKMRAELHRMPLHMADGGKVEKNPEEDRKEPVVVNVNPPQPVVPGMPVSAVPTNEEILNQDRGIASQVAPAQQPPVVTPQPMAPMAQIPSYAGMTMQGLSEQQAGIQEQAKAISNQAQAQAMVQQEKAAQLQAIQAEQQAKEAQLLNEQTQLETEIKNGKLDPGRLYKNTSTGQKIANFIGIALGGYGGPNMALDRLNKMVEDDIAAQRAELGKAPTLLEANYKKLGNMRAAMDMTRANILGITAAKMEEAGLKAMSPLAKSNALQASGKLKMESAAIIKNLSMYQMATSGAGGTNLIQKIDAVVPEQFKKEAVKEAQEYSQIQSSLNQVDGVLRDAFEATKFSENISSPIESKKRREVAYAQLFPIVKSIVGEKMTDNDARTLITPYLPGALTSEKTLDDNIKKLKSKLISQSTGKTQILRDYNLIPKQEASARNPAEERIYNWAKANPKDPRAIQVLQRLGSK